MPPMFTHESGSERMLCKICIGVPTIVLPAMSTIFLLAGAFTVEFVVHEVLTVPPRLGPVYIEPH